jgi:TIR domain
MLTENMILSRRLREMEAMQQDSPPSLRHDYLFVSYSRRDKIKVENIVEKLRDAGLEIWMDTRNIEEGERWDDIIGEKIIHSKAILYFVSPNSKKSSHVANELDLIKEHNISNEQNIKIYPIWIEGKNWEKCVIFGFSRIKYYDLRGEQYESELTKLIDKLKALMGKSPRITEKFEDDSLTVPGTTGTSIEQDNARLKKPYVAVAAFLLIILMLVVGSVIGAIGTQHSMPPFNWFAVSPLSISNSVLVTNANDSGPGSLREYVEHAQGNTLVQFLPSLAGQRIDLTSKDLEIGQNLIIQGTTDIEQPMDNCINNENITSRYNCIIGKDTGEGLDKFLKIKIGSSKGYRIHIKDTVHVIFRDILFSDTDTAKSGTNTAFLFNEGQIALQYCWVSGNKSAYNGAGLTNQRGIVSLTKSVFFQNMASGGEGGAIYNLFGEVTLDRSYIWKNTSQNSGGGLSSLGGSVHLSSSEVSWNEAQGSGGGITLANGTLILDLGSAIESNITAASGGGIALFGANATIVSSNIDQNKAQKYGAGILVVKNPDNNYVSSLVVKGIELDNPQAVYYIGQNQIVEQNQPPKTENIRGIRVPWQDETSDTTMLYDDDPTITPVLGNPPNPHPPTENPNLRGIVDINRFCEKAGYSYGSFGPGSTDSLGIICAGFQHRTQPFSTKDVCNQTYSSNNSAIIDRVSNYNDPTSLQCYKNASVSHLLKKSDLDEYCRKFSQNEQPLYSGAVLFGNAPNTAYDWKCQPIDPKAGPVGISVTQACRSAYGDLAFDRLVNYNSENGWECRVFDS